MKTKRNLSIAFLMAAVYLAFMTGGVFAAEEHDHDHEKEHADHDHEKGEHDHSEFEYLYGNHYCPACNYADLVDPHFFADISNKAANIYARVYLCDLGCADEIKKNVGKYYTETYRTDREKGKEIPARDLKNELCPSSGEPVDGKTSIEYNGMIVHFCCEECVASFVKAPEPGMRKLLPIAKEYKWPGHGNEGETGHEADHDHEHDEKEHKDK